MVLPYLSSASIAFPAVIPYTIRSPDDSGEEGKGRDGLYLFEH